MESKRKITLLLVDDDEAWLDLMSLLLAARGVTVLAASDVPTAFRLIALEKPDAAVTDLEMPGLDGFELRRCAELAGLTLPILALSGSTDRARIARARAGFQCVLTKPCDASSLMKAVHATLGIRDDARQVFD